MAAAGVKFLTVLIILAGILYSPVKQKLTVFGALRKEIHNKHGSELKIIPNTLQCEDLHYHQPSNLLFTACQTDSAQKRRQWFPPLDLFDTQGAGQGTIVVVDPATFEAKHLKLSGFKGPFVTHGIDIYYIPADPMNVYIFAINHLPHPNANDPAQAQKADSQIELFRYAIGEDTAYHLRSIKDPAVKTPNDIFATSPTSFYVTNDHHYRTGPLRLFEDLGNRHISGWSDTIHVSFSFTGASNTDASAGVKATSALKGLHNNNGLGHAGGDATDIVLIGSAASGELTIARHNLAPRANEPSDLKIKVLEHIQLDSCIDNPSYYWDPYATSGNNASGIVVAGLTKGLELEARKHDGGPIPNMVWHIKQTEDRESWSKTVLFEDDGKTVSGAATAVMVPADPAKHDGKKKAWLFVTGFMTDAIVATLVDI